MDYYAATRQRIDYGLRELGIDINILEDGAKHGEEEYIDIVHRRNFIKKYSWAMPTEEAINAIAAYSPIIEVGAVLGFWAKLLEDVGADVVAFDNGETDSNEEPYTTILDGGPEDILDNPGRTLFLCWPPFWNDMALDCLSYYKGQYLAYVGEGAGGCTGGDAFHKRLKAGWEGVELIYLPNWAGIHDYLEIYERKRRVR